MDIYQGLDNIDNYHNIVVALGNFDGVHLGHRQLIRRTIEIAKKYNGTPAVYTFDPHPLKVIKPDLCPPMLLTKEEKIRLFSELGIKVLIIAPFTQEVSGISPEQFVQEILVEKLKVKCVVVGYNYNFGYKGSGDPAMLTGLAAKNGFAVEVVPPVKCGETEVSSTLIRNFLLEGNVVDAAKYLGYFPFVNSRVVAGFQRGREIGFPTANLSLSDDVLAPANGVYAVKVYFWDKCWYGVANIGVKPTFEPGLPRNLEVNIFDFKGDIYGTKIKLEFIRRIRGECQFGSVDELVQQIKKDVQAAKSCLASEAAKLNGE
jgi:riboflavin kinase/FMN adenylyltransferase